MVFKFRHFNDNYNDVYHPRHETITMILILSPKIRRCRQTEKVKKNEKVLRQIHTYILTGTIHTVVYY